MLEFMVHNQKKEFADTIGNVMKQNVELLKKVQLGEGQYTESLGWLDTDECAGEENLARIEALAEKIRKEAEVFVLIGVGGSNNAARAVIEAFQKEDGPEIVYAGNTLSPHSLVTMMNRIKGKSVFINCIAKNFETLEPGSSFRILRLYLYKTYGEEAAKRIIATGTKGSSLEKLCDDNGYTFIDFPKTVGGRYTSMTNVGLLPMAVAGIDIRALVCGGHDMQLKLRSQGAENNQAYHYACARNALYRKGYSVEMLTSFEPQYRCFFKWWLQLFAESEGKDNKGILPVTSEYSEDLHAVGQFVQDGAPILFETFIDVKKQNASFVVPKSEQEDYFSYLDEKDFWEINKVSYQATLAAHSEKLPCFIISVDELDEYHFGQLFYFFQFACYLSCGIMGVNAFDQPGVEAYKKWMFEALGK